jgi:hypothetical protein
LRSKEEQMRQSMLYLGAAALAALALGACKKAPESSAPAASDTSSAPAASKAPSRGDPTRQ